MNHRVFATLLSLLPLTPGCAAPNRLIPPGGQVAATRDGTLARLRVYYSPPPGSLLPRGTVAIYVALRNLGSQPLRVDYRDFFLDPPRGAALPSAERAALEKVAGLLEGQQVAAR